MQLTPIFARFTLDSFPGGELYRAINYLSRLIGNRRLATIVSRRNARERTRLPSIILPARRQVINKYYISRVYVCMCVCGGDFLRCLNTCLLDFFMTEFSQKKRI